MSVLGEIKKGRVIKPYFVCIYAVEGVGKTTFASEAPEPLFACIEDGANHLDVARLPQIKSFEQLTSYISDLILDHGQYKTFVIDSLDHLEPIIWQSVCAEHKVEGIEDLGYGKGYVYATDKWIKLFSLLKTLRDKMNVILICHAAVKTFNDPSLIHPYDRYGLKLHKSAYALTKENVDALLFATYETTVTAADKKNDSNFKGRSDGTRMLFTEYRAHHDGKNRYGLPYELSFPKSGSWAVFSDAVKASDPSNQDSVVREISALLPTLKDLVAKKSAMEQFAIAKEKNDYQKLVKIRDRLQAIVQ